MQSSLRTLINKPNKRRCNLCAGLSNLDILMLLESHLSYCLLLHSRHADSESDQQPKLKQPSLLSRLAQSSGEQLATPIASQKHSAASSKASQTPHSDNEHSTKPVVRASDQQTGLCPVCGLELPVQLLQQHVEEELALLTDSSNNCMASAFANSSKQPAKLATHLAPVTTSHRHRPPKSRQHPAGQQKVPAACCTLWQRFLSSMCTIKHLPSGTCHPAVMLHPTLAWRHVACNSGIHMS